MSKPLDENIYNEEFHKDRGLITNQTADSVFDLLLKTIPEISSVVDVGCGTGTWLRVFKEKKTAYKEVLGVDGGYLPLDQLEIAEEEFYAQNLEDRISIDKNFDLAISLEVAEHLSPERADSFVEDLTGLSDIVLFSAAIPGQGGEGHINEQFLSYWEEKFEKRNYKLLDCIRPNIIREGDKIPWWYKQNIVVFVNAESQYVDRLQDINRPGYVDMISVELYIQKLQIIGSLAGNNDELRRVLNEQTIVMKKMAETINGTSKQNE